MLPSFTDTSSHKLDSKGRVSIPAAFRRVLELGDPESGPQGTGENVNVVAPRVVMVLGDRADKYLEGYTMEAILEMRAKVKRLPVKSSSRRYLQHKYSSNTVTLNVDEAGRMVLPQRLRDKIGLKKDAEFVGAGETFQVWLPEDYAIEASEIEDWAAMEVDPYAELNALSEVV